MWDTGKPSRSSRTVHRQSAPLPLLLSRRFHLKGWRVAAGERDGGWGGREDLGGRAGVRMGRTRLSLEVPELGRVC